MPAKMDKRLPVTEQTHERVTKLKAMLNMTYDDVINMMIDIIQQGETLEDAGAHYGLAWRSKKHITKPIITNETIDDNQQ